MARPARRSTPGPVSPPPRRGWWLPVCLGLAAILGAGLALAWREHQALARMQAGLPARPNLSGRAPVLGELLARAEARTGSTDTFAEGLAELGRLYHANDFPREAAACWRLLRVAQPDEPRWCYYLADLSRATGDPDGLAALLGETLRLAPGYAPARLQLASLQFKSGDSTEAGRNYRQVLAERPQDPHARLGLVRVALQAGRTPEARAQLEVLLKDSPHFATAHNLYAGLLAAAGDEAGAARHRWLGVETLRYRDPVDPWLDELREWCHDYGRLCALGTLEMQTENRTQARALFERAIRLNPGEAAAYELLASLHLKHDDPAAARDLLEQALPRLTGRRSPTS